MKKSTVARLAAASLIAAVGISASVAGAGASEKCDTLEFQGIRLKETGTQVTPWQQGAYDAGTYSMSAVSNDATSGRVTNPQLSERWRIQFSDQWGNILAESPVTGDIPDTSDNETWSGSLGTMDLPAGITKTRAIHVGDGQSANSVNPISFTLCLQTGEPATTTSTTEAPETTEAPTTSVANNEEEAPPASVLTETTVKSADPDAPETPDEPAELAVTGASNAQLAVAGAAMLAAGGVVLNARRKEQLED